MAPRDVLWQLTIDTRTRDGLTVLALTGRISHASARDLVAALEAQAARGRLIVDIAGVDYISSAGFHALEQAARRRHSDGAQLILCGMQDAVRPAFTLAGPIASLLVVPDYETAIRHVTIPADSDAPPH